jgi:hypothetical protein
MSIAVIQNSPRSLREKVTIRAIYSLPERQPRHAEYQIGGGSVSGYDRPFITRCSSAKADRFPSWVDALKKILSGGSEQYRFKTSVERARSFQVSNTIRLERADSVPWTFSNSIGHGLPS